MNVGAAIEPIDSGKAWSERNRSSLPPGLASRGWYHGIEPASASRRLKIEPELKWIRQRYVGQDYPVWLIQISRVAYLIRLANITDYRHARIKVYGQPFCVYSKSGGSTGGTAKLIAHDDAVEARIISLNFCDCVRRVGRPVDGRMHLAFHGRFDARVALLQSLCSEPRARFEQKT